MRNRLLFRLLDPVSAAVARQLARPSGWFGRIVMTRALNRGNRPLLAAALGHLSVPVEGRLLDVGFGGGGLLELAARRGFRHLAGIDPSADAVRRLREAPPGWARGIDLQLECAVVEAIPFGGGAFDAVLSTNTVYFWPDLGAAFAELRRVLSPGGQLLLGFSGAAKLREFGRITRHGFHFHPEADLVAAAERAGLAEVALVALHGGQLEGDFLLTARGR